MIQVEVARMGKKNVLYVNQLEGLLPFEVFTSDVTTMTMTTMTYDLVLGTCSRYSIPHSISLCIY